jgi:very-short-patch-repair endonuclease
VRLAVEIDGATHGTVDERRHDEARTRYLEGQGWRVIRFWNADVFSNLDGVVEGIRNTCWEQQYWLSAERKESP